MNTIHRSRAIKNILGGLAGISLIILIHEMGHFLFAHLFGVPTPLFSLGFGPALSALPIGQTVFQISLLPFGGYVELNEKILATLPYLSKIFIIFAGVLFNFAFAYAILLYYSIKNHTSIKNTLMHTITPDQREQFHITSNVMGPIGIISLIGKSLTINTHLFWFILAILSLNIGLLNMLPLPFFDGGKACIITIETITGTAINATALWLISSI
ncbi:MAG TPA: site-2 protease family protein, partial [Candidatus Babeliales bacterium]|nr:site-2 protease family protein [Candidatus Babeliales bacterium]